MAATEGQQVMALISKRLRTHRKKYNRITEMEESISQGKTLNKEQKETILSKPIVTALIQELEKLRLPPPSTAVSEEIISLPAKKNKKAKGIHLFSLRVLATHRTIINLIFLLDRHVRRLMRLRRKT